MSIKLKILRVQAGMTLEELARASDLTRSYVSRLERGLSTPSVGASLKLAKALGVPVEEVFAKASEADPVVIRRATAAPEPTPHVSRRVSSALPDHRMVAFVLQPTDALARENPASHHRGEEILYVLRGQVVLRLAQRIETLSVGDSAHFNAGIPHKITSVGLQRAEVLLVIAQDEHARFNPA